MKIVDSNAKDELITRLKRIEGQVRGVQSMLEDERECREIMQQFTAISSAIKSTSRIYFREYASACLVGIEGKSLPEDQQKRQRLVEEMISLLDKTP